MYKLYITARGGGVEKAIQRAGGIPQQEDGKIRKLSIDRMLRRVSGFL